LTVTLRSQAPGLSYPTILFHDRWARGERHHSRVLPQVEMIEVLGDRDEHPGGDHGLVRRFGGFCSAFTHVCLTSHTHEHVRRSTRNATLPEWLGSSGRGSPSCQSVRTDSHGSSPQTTRRSPQWMTQCLASASDPKRPPRLAGRHHEPGRPGPSDRPGLGGGVRNQRHPSEPPSSSKARRVTSMIILPNRPPRRWREAVALDHHSRVPALGCPGCFDRVGSRSLVDPREVWRCRR